MTIGETGGVYYLKVAVATADSHVLKAAVASRKLRILGCFLYAAGAVNVTLEDEDGTDLIGPINFGDADMGFVLPTSLVGYQETASGKGLNLLLSGAVGVRGVVVVQTVK